MANWTDMRRHEFDANLAPALFDLDELPGQLIAEPGTLFAELPEPQPACTWCGSDRHERLSLGNVAKCNDAEACAERTSARTITHTYAVIGNGPRQMACSCGARSRWYRSQAPIDRAIERHAAVVERMANHAE